MPQVSQVIFLACVSVRLGINCFRYLLLRLLWRIFQKRIDFWEEKKQVRFFTKTEIKKRFFKLLNNRTLTAINIKLRILILRPISIPCNRVNASYQIYNAHILPSWEVAIPSDRVNASYDIFKILLSLAGQSQSPLIGSMLPT